MPEQEGQALYALGHQAARSGLGPLLEVGTYCAKSAIYLGAGAARGQGGTLVFTIDHHRGSEELQPGWPDHDPELVDGATGQTDTLLWARQNVAKAGLETTVVLVVGESAAVALQWRTPLSLVFIDGGHGKEVAWADYDGWAPKVAIGGWLALHDVFTDPAEGGQVPYDIYCQAVATGHFSPEGEVGSLRWLRRQ